MSAPPSHAFAKRPRQRNDRDCVVAVFREVTGEDEQTADSRFKQCRSGAQGFTMCDLSACFIQAGWMMARDEREIPSEQPASSTFWRGFTGRSILEYCVEGVEAGHVVVVRPGGIVLDPAQASPEKGEFIEDYFRPYRGRLRKFLLSTVFKP